MSDIVIKELSSFKNFEYIETRKSIVNLKDPVSADMDEFLEITHILDTNRIKYKFTTNVDIRILGKK